MGRKAQKKRIEENKVDDQTSTRHLIRMRVSIKRLFISKTFNWLPHHEIDEAFVKKYGPRLHKTYNHPRD